MSKITIEQKKVKTPVFRVSYPSIDKPKSFQGQEPKFSVVMLIPKDADLTAMRKAVYMAKVEKWGKDKAKWPPMRETFRDGDREKPDTTGYKGHYFATASAKTKPGVIGRDQEVITDFTNGFYAGCYAKATLIAFAYDNAGNRGVSFSLQNLLKIKDGKKFSGRKEATEEFDAADFDGVEDESENSESYEGGESTGEDGTDF